jgi:hypothetical protein
MKQRKMVDSADQKIERINIFSRVARPNLS